MGYSLEATQQRALGTWGRRAGASREESLLGKVMFQPSPTEEAEAGHEKGGVGRRRKWTKHSKEREQHMAG